MPPKYISTTNASIINATALLEINENYLLAACLEDCLLAKININTGVSTPLLSYKGNNGAINITNKLDIPIIPCSLIKNKEFIFIAYTKIDYYQNSANKTHTIFKFALLNNTINENPKFNQTFSRKSGSSSILLKPQRNLKKTFKTLVCTAMLYEQLF